MQPQADGAPAIPAEVGDKPMPPHLQRVADEVAVIGSEHTHVPLTPFPIRRFVGPIRAVPMPVELGRRPIPIVEKRVSTEFDEDMWELVKNGRVIARQVKYLGNVNIGHISLAQLIPDDADDAEGNETLSYAMLYGVNGPSS